MSDELIMIDEWVDALPPERQMVCLQRALQALDYEYEIGADGQLILDEDLMNHVWDHEALEEALRQQYFLMHAHDAFEELAEEGSIVADGIDEDGHVRWVVADEG